MRAGEIHLAQDVLRHPGVVERHVVVGLVAHHEPHDRARRLVVARVGHRMADVEDDARGLGAVAGGERVDHRARALDLPGERVAGGAVARALDAARGRHLLLADLDLDGIAERLDLREPLAGAAARTWRPDGCGWHRARAASLARHAWPRRDRRAPHTPTPRRRALDAWDLSGGERSQRWGNVHAPARQVMREAGSAVAQAVRRSGGQAVRRSGGQAVRRSGGQAVGGQAVRRTVADRLRLGA